MKVRIGIGLGTRTRCRARSTAQVVDTIERLGFDSLWLSERISGEAPDPIVAMSYAAGRTTHLKFGMSVLVLPGRNPVVLAKELATLAVMSGGRLLPAFGLGVADGVEHQAFGVQRNERARWFDEALTVMRKCWFDDVVEHDGERFHYEGLQVRPQPDRLDVWLGGIAPSELRRVGRMADGWLPSFVTPNDAAAGRAVIEQVAAEHERAIEDDHYGVLIPYTLDDRARRACSPGWPAAGPISTTRPSLVPVGWDAADRHDQALRRRRHDEVRRPPGQRARRRRVVGRPPRRRRRRPPPAGDLSRSSVLRSTCVPLSGSEERQDRPRAAIAALRPGMAETPPPRRAPAPHTNTLAWAVSTPQRPSSSASSANGHCRSRWKMWPPGIPRLASISSGPITSMHAGSSEAVGDRLVEHAVERAQDRRRRRGQRAVGVVAEQPRRHVQAEQRQRLHAGGPQLGAEDRRVGQRVAVDLARRQVRHHAGRGLAVGRARAARTPR